MRGNGSYNRSVLESLILVTQFGLQMIVPIAMLSALGIWIDKRLGTGFWVIILFFVGAIAGGQNIYRMARRIYSRPGGKDKQGRQRIGRKEAGTSDNQDIEKM